MLQKKGILTEEAKEKLMFNVVGKRPVTIDVGAEAHVWHDGEAITITVDKEGAISIDCRELVLSIVKVHPRHVVLVPGRIYEDDQKRI